MVAGAGGRAGQVFAWDLFGSRQDCRRIADGVMAQRTALSQVFPLGGGHEVDLRVQPIELDDFEGLLWQGPVRPVGAASSVADSYVETLGAALATLTESERTIVGWLAKGARTRQIAERLYISQSAVRNHLSAIYRKLDVPDQVSLLERLLGTEPFGPEAGRIP